MDVDRKTFHWQLPRMLRALAGAHFVAVDFELSGIHSKVVHRTRAVEQAYGNKQTLQQRYEEAKEAAERYQILQVGLTIVTEDAEKGLWWSVTLDLTLRLTTISRYLYCTAVQSLLESYP